MGDAFSYFSDRLSDATCKDDLQEMSTFEVFFGCVLWTVTTVSIIPSLLKPMRMKSTIGMSADTLLLTNLQQTATVLNTFMIKSPQLKHCSTYGFGECFPGLITLGQTMTAWFLLFLVFITVVWYPEPNTPQTVARNKRLWWGQCIGCFGITFVMCLWSMIADCPSSLAVVATVWGWISSLLMVFRFGPQLYTSCVSKTAGSISYITYGVVGVGGFAMTYFQVSSSGEQISTWLPVFIGNCFQTLIVLTCAYYDIQAGRCSKGGDNQVDKSLTAGSSVEI